MPYRICKSFEIESGHMLSKHPDRCRFPHGHSRRVEVVIAADTLDDHDMVVDFAAVKLALAGVLDDWDHAMMVNSEDDRASALREISDRVIVLDGVDPTTEVLARRIHDHLKACLGEGRTYVSKGGATYRLRPEARLERVRVTETSTSWAEYQSE